MGHVSILWEFWEFLSQRRKYWLMPIVMLLLMLGLLVVLTSSSALAPFIYTIF